jgi:hypothetical protein
MSDVHLANEEAARTETGELKDQGAQPGTTTTPETTKPTQEATKPEKAEDKKSIVNEGAPKAEKAAEGAPKEYTAFKVPDGFEMPEETSKEVNAMFKDMNLSQEAGQKLIDYYAKQSQQAAEAPIKFWMETQEKWQNEVRLDPEIGPKLNDVRTTISKAIDGMGNPKLASDFRDAMDYTGAGNNLAFIKAFYRLAQQVTEGTHVAGAGPSKFGQAAPGTGERPSLAHSLYPKLP